MLSDQSDYILNNINKSKTNVHTMKYQKHIITKRIT